VLYNVDYATRPVNRSGGWPGLDDRKDARRISLMADK